MKLFKRLLPQQARQWGKEQHPHSILPNRSPQLQTFILEPILTPSGFLDGPDDTPDSDPLDTDPLDLVAVPDLPDLAPVDDTLEPLGFIENSAEAANETAAATHTSFQSGVFTVGNRNSVSIDFLFDGGAYRSQLALFNLDGIDHFDLTDPGETQDFIQAAAHRALSNSEDGYIVISDYREGARFTGTLGERDWNQGNYLGPKTFDLEEGDRFGLMLVPKGTVKDVAKGTLDAAKRPLFSIAAANPHGASHFGHLSDITGDGGTFAIEDLRVDGDSDLDYNDLIFQIRGATTAETRSLSDVIDPTLDWHRSDLGQAIGSYDPNAAPEALQLTSETFFTADETIEVVGQVFDADGVDDLTQVEVQLRETGGDWQTLSPVTQFSSEADGFAGFDYELTDLDPGRYELQAIAYDQRGASSGPVTQTFTVLSLPDNSELPDSLKSALELAIDLDNYDPDALAETTEWVVSIQTGASPQELAAQVGAVHQGSTNHIANTYVWEFPTELDPVEVVNRLSELSGVEYTYPLVKSELTAQFIANAPLGDDSGVLQLAETPAADVSVAAAWQDARGQGVVIGIVDDGLEYGHTDLQTNYRADLSRDFREVNGFGIYDGDPAPEAGDFQGTAVAGIAAASGDGNSGVQGVAPNATLAGLRLLGSPLNDLQIADTLSYLHDDIDIYNNSWKLPWQTAFGSERRLTLLPLSAFELHASATQGRDGLGNIQVFAAGNDGEAGGNVNDNAFANSRYTIAVAAIDGAGKQATYSELGAPLLVSAYAGDRDGGIATTDRTGATGYSPGDYANYFGGTAASAAWVSGLAALILEVNPALTWRDVQHILIETAQKNDFGTIDPDRPRQTDTGWWLNGGDRWVNHKYGFGAVDAAAAVALAKDWKTVNPEIQLTSGLQAVGRAIPDDGEPLTSTVTIEDNVTLEWVEVVFDADHSHRGDLEVVLVAPDGTESILAAPDADSGDDYNWVFTSARHWGDSSRGDWTLRVTDRQGNDQTGEWNNWKLNLYGTHPTVTLTAIDTTAKEGGSDSARFAVSRTGNLKHDLVVEYNSTIGPFTAIPGKDFSLTGTVTIPAGESVAEIEIVPTDDDIPETPEYARLTLKTSSAYEIGSVIGQNFFYIADNETPAIYITAYEAENSHYASESGNSGFFRLDRYGDLDPAFTVNYSIGGTAIDGEDYQISRRTATFSQNSRRHYFSIHAIDDVLVEGEETVELTIIPGENYVAFEGHGSDIITIWDNDDKPTVELVATQVNASEFGDRGEFTISVTDGNGNPWVLETDLTVDFLGRGFHPIARITDFDLFNANGEKLESSIVIPQGQSSAKIFVDPIDDAIAEPTENLTIYLASRPEYAVGRKELAGIHILDNDTPAVEWLHQSGTAGFDYANGLALDGAGYLYLAGSTSGTLPDASGTSANANAGLHDAFLTKYSADGSTAVWTRQWGTAGFDTANSVAVDAAGNVYITGWSDGSVDGNRDTFVVKYNSEGVLQWETALGTLPSFESAGYDISNGAMAVANDGIYVAGLTYGDLAGANQGEADAFIAKLDLNDGDLRGLHQLGTAAWDEAQGITVNDQGDVYLTGHTRGDLAGANQGEADAFVAKFDGSDDITPIWTRQLGTTGADEARSIVVNPADEVYIAGQTQGQFPGQNTIGGDGDAFASRLRGRDGRILETRQLGSAAFDSASSIAIDDNGSVYLTGRTYGDLGGSAQGNADAWIWQYDSALRLQDHWKLHLGTAAEDGATGIAVSGSGVYLAGSTGGSFTSYGQASQGGDDVWLARIA